MTNPLIVAAVVAASSLASGCHDEPAFVVLVVNSDLVSPSEVNTFGVSVAPGPFEPPPGFASRWSIATPACDRLTNPELVPFDAALAPGIELAQRFADDGTP